MGVSLSYRGGQVSDRVWPDIGAIHASLKRGYNKISLMNPVDFTALSCTLRFQLLSVTPRWVIEFMIEFVCQRTENE